MTPPTGSREELREALAIVVRDAIRTVDPHSSSRKVESAVMGAVSDILALSPVEQSPEPTVKTEAFRCFHCGEVFTVAAARIHFGDTQLASPACTIDAERFREMEALVSRYQEEDTDLHREIGRLRCDLATQTRRAEERGYDKGLQDGMALTPTTNGDSHE